MQILNYILLYRITLLTYRKEFQKYQLISFTNDKNERLNLMMIHQRCFPLKNKLHV